MKPLKDMFRAHSEAILIALAVIFLVIIGWYLYATIQAIVPQVNHAIANPPTGDNPGFGLDAVSKIDFRGTPSTTAISPPSTVTSVSVSSSATSSAGSASGTVAR